MKAIGEFAVDLQPLDTYASGESFARMSIDKTFSGDLVASSQGEMLSLRTAVDGSAGYVAIEQVSGTLAGKQGNFALQHYGTMNRGDSFLLLEVIPDSGTGELTDISGKMSIIIEDGQHRYEFEYEL